MTWRSSAAPIIAEIIQKVGKDDIKRLRKEFLAAYPFGERRMWPYKVWLSEINRQLGRPLNAPRKKDDEQQDMMF